MIFSILLKRELHIGFRQRLDIGMLFVFALLGTLLFPIALGPEPQLLRQIAVGIIWVILIFAAQLSIPTVWRQDAEDGTLEQMCMAGFPLEWLVISKAISIWILCLGSLGLLLPALAYSLYLPWGEILILLICFVITSVPLSFLTVTGATLTLSNARGSLLSAVLLLPFYLPLLIFSGAASEVTSIGDSPNVYISMLTGLSLVLTPLLLYVNVFLISRISE